MSQYDPVDIDDVSSNPSSIGSFWHPEFVPVSRPTFRWGNHDKESFLSIVKDAYMKVIKWRRNLFCVPSGNLGKSFVSELARLYKSYAESTALESVAMYGAFLVPVLLLQKPHTSSTNKDHVVCPERRLQAWKDGDIADLLHEGATIQQRLKSPRHIAHQSISKGKLTSQFAKLMFECKTGAAIALLDGKGHSKVLNPNQLTSVDGIPTSILGVLKLKHPPAHDSHADALDNDETCESALDPHSVLFDYIDSGIIR